MIEIKYESIIKQLDKGLSDTMYKKLEGIITWDGYYYAYTSTKSGNKYYRSKGGRFDDTFGGVQQITEEEYHEAAVAYAKAMR